MPHVVIRVIEERQKRIEAFPAADGAQNIRRELPDVGIRVALKGGHARQSLRPQRDEDFDGGVSDKGAV
jgi:hypothetical protein